MKIKYLQLGLVVVLLGFLFKSCQGNREFKTIGVIESVSDNEVVIDTLIPNPLRKSLRECSLISKGEEELKCQEGKDGLLYTHSIKTRDVKTKVSELKLGNTVRLRLPELDYYSLTAQRQHVRMTRYGTQVNTPVFLVGEYEGNQPKIKKVFEGEGSPLTKTEPSSVQSIRVCVIPSQGEHMFVMRQEDNGGVKEYELMFPNVREDQVGAGEALNEEPNHTRVLTFSTTMTRVIGMGDMESFSDCVNPSSVPIPPYKSERLVSKGNGSGQVLTPHKSSSGSSKAWLSIPLSLLLTAGVWVGFIKA